MKKTLAVLIVVALAAIPAPPAAALSVDDDLVSLVAMPLAVAAVSELTDIPTNELLEFVSVLNDADVSPPQFIEVVRYVPVALVVVDDSQPRFVEVVRMRQQAGIQGLELVTFIEQRLNTYGLPTVVDFDVTAPRVVVVEDEFVPAVVRTRVAYVKAHPHGGPPGQLKKQLGAQTGAEIVHDSIGRGRPAKKEPKREVKRVARSNDDRDTRVVVVKEKPAKQKHVEKAKHDDGKGHDNGKGHGNSGKQKGKGKG
jgi:hypothetical protein